jgi:hypothetical protein
MRSATPAYGQQSLRTSGRPMRRVRYEFGLTPAALRQSATANMPLGFSACPSSAFRSITLARHTPVLSAVCSGRVIVDLGYPTSASTRR